MTIEVKSFDHPDEVRQFVGHGYAEVVRVEGRDILRGVFEPGWQWSIDVKPIAGTEYCETAHLLYIVAGRMHVWIPDPAYDVFIEPGMVVSIPPGHDAVVVGEETCVSIDFGSVGQYAKGS
jgi:hypothetical protein